MDTDDVIRCTVSSGLAERRRSGRAWKKFVAESGDSVYYRPAIARKVASGMQPKLYVRRCLGHHARIGSIRIMSTDGVVKAAGFRRMNGKSRWNVDSWNTLRDLFWDVTEGGADAAEAIQAPRPQIVDKLWAPRRRHVTRAGLRKCGVTIVCAACSDIAVHEKTSKPHTEECRTRIGELVEHDPDGHERLHVHKRRRDVEPKVEVTGDPSRERTRAIPHIWNSKMLRCRRRHLASPRL